MIKTRIMSWVGHSWYEEQETGIQGFGGEKLGNEITWKTKA
jgi:hypothetical protein